MTDRGWGACPHEGPEREAPPLPSDDVPPTDAEIAEWWQLYVRDDANPVDVRYALRRARREVLRLRATGERPAEAPSEALTEAANELLSWWDSAGDDPVAGLEGFAAELDSRLSVLRAALRSGAAAPARGTFDVTAYQRRLVELANEATNGNNG